MAHLVLSCGQSHDLHAGALLSGIQKRIISGDNINREFKSQTFAQDECRLSCHVRIRV